MKKVLALVMAMTMALALVACSSSKPAETEAATQAATEAATEAAVEEAEGDGSDMTVATEFEFDIKENDDIFVEKTIFNEDVIINGDYGKITFAWCEFNGDIVNASPQGTTVWIGEGNEFNNGAKCVFRNGTQEANTEYDMPKFMTGIPVEAVTDNCIGTVTNIGGNDINFDGKTYTMADATVFLDYDNLEAGMVEYTGQDNANFLYVGKWKENGEDTEFVMAAHIVD